MKSQKSKSSYKKNNQGKSGQTKEKVKHGATGFIFASILWAIYSYSNFFPLALLWIQGWNMGFPDRAITEDTTMKLAKVFIVCTIVFLIGRHIFNIRKKDLEQAID